MDDIINIIKISPIKINTEQHTLINKINSILNFQNNENINDNLIEYCNKYIQLHKEIIKFMNKFNNEKKIKIKESEIYIKNITQKLEKLNTQMDRIVNINIETNKIDNGVSNNVDTDIDTIIYPFDKLSNFEKKYIDKLNCRNSMIYLSDFKGMKKIMRDIVFHKLIDYRTKLKLWNNNVLKLKLLIDEIEHNIGLIKNNISSLRGNNLSSINYQCNDSKEIFNLIKIAKDLNNKKDLIKIELVELNKLKPIPEKSNSIIYPEVNIHQNRINNYNKIIINDLSNIYNRFTHELNNKFKKDIFKFKEETKSIITELEIEIKEKRKVLKKIKCDTFVSVNEKLINYYNKNLFNLEKKIINKKII